MGAPQHDEGEEWGLRPGSPSPPSPLTLATFLPYRLNVAAALVSEGLARRYGERFGVAIPEWRVLVTVAEFRRITAKAIGLHAHMGKVKVSRATATLEARGLIRREPNSADGREAFLILTEAGDAMVAAIAPLAADYVGRLLAGFDAGDRAALERLLDKLRDGALAMEPA